MTQTQKFGAGAFFRVPLAGTLVAAFVVASIVPGSAKPLSDLGDFRADASRHHSTFHRHFYRGQHSHGVRDGKDARFGLGYEDATIGAGLGLLGGTAYFDETVAEGAASTDEAMGYCADRFRSYDPASGTYLGYDGERHPCP